MVHHVVLCVAGSIHLRERTAEQCRQSRFREHGFRSGEDVARRRGLSAGVAVGIFNLFNRANFNLPNRTFGNPNFGRISSAKNPREMQFGLRFAF